MSETNSEEMREYITMPTPTEAEKQKAWKERGADITDYFSSGYPATLIKTKEERDSTALFLDFLLGKIDKHPTYLFVKLSDYNFARHTKESLAFIYIYDLLAPFQDWTFVDHRIMKYTSQSDYFHFKDDELFGKDSGYFFKLHNWLEENLLEFPGFSFAQMLEVFKKEYNIPTKKILGELMTDRFLLFPDYQLTEMGKFIIGYFEKEPEFVLEKVNKGAFLRLMLQYAPGKILPYLDTFNLISDESHLNANTMEALCFYDAKKYIPLLIEKIDVIKPCIDCEAGVAVLLREYGEESHWALAEELVRSSVAQLARKNERYKFHWHKSWHISGWVFEDFSYYYWVWICKHFPENAPDILLLYVENRNFKNKTLNVTRAAIEYLGERGLEIVKAVMDKGFAPADYFDTETHAYTKIFKWLEKIDYTSINDYMWNFARTSSFKVSMLFFRELQKNHPEKVREEAIVLLKSKNGEKRETGIHLLNDADELKFLAPLLQTEKKDTIRNLVVEKVYAVAGEINREEIQRRIASAEKRGKMKKIAVKWMDSISLPPLYWKEGGQLSEQEFHFLVYRQNAWNRLSPDPEARDIYPLIDKTKSGPFAAAMLEATLNNGKLKAKNRFAMSLTGLFGDDTIVQILQKEAISDKNPNVCEILGMVGSNRAGAALNAIAQSFNTKYPNVRDAAESAFEEVAEKQGMHPTEFLYTLIPDFGFDGLSLLLANNYKAVIGNNLKLAFINPEGKKVKSISSTSTEVKAQIKTLKSGITSALKQYIPVVEYALSNQVVWPKRDWEKIFLHKPLTFAIGQNLIWGAYEGEQLAQAFMMDDQGILFNEKKEGIQLSDNAIVKLIYPMVFTNQQKGAWEEVIKKKKITPPFQQLDRDVFYPDASVEKRKLLPLEEFKGPEYKEEINASTFMNRARKKGWSRGTVVDGGRITSYRKEFAVYNLEAYMVIEGLAVPLDYDYNKKVKVIRVYFIPLGSAYSQSSRFDDIFLETDYRLMAYGDVPSIAYSEVIRDVTEIFR